MALVVRPKHALGRDTIEEDPLGRSAGPVRAGVQVSVTSTNITVHVHLSHRVCVRL